MVWTGTRPHPPSRGAVSRLGKFLVPGPAGLMTIILLSHDSRNRATLTPPRGSAVPKPIYRYTHTHTHEHSLKASKSTTDGHVVILTAQQITTLQTITEPEDDRFTVVMKAVYGLVMRERGMASELGAAHAAPTDRSDPEPDLQLWDAPNSNKFRLYQFSFCSYFS
jgi:hypothetical protein